MWLLQMLQPGVKMDLKEKDLTKLKGMKQRTSPLVKTERRILKFWQKEAWGEEGGG